MAGSRAGLKRVKKTVKTKKGSAQRTYWVRASDAVKRAGRAVGRGARAAGGAIARNKGKIIAGAALLGAAAGGVHMAKRHGLISSSGRSMTPSWSVGSKGQSAEARIWRGSMAHPRAGQLDPPGAMRQMRDKLFGARTASFSVGHPDQQASRRVWRGSVGGGRRVGVDKRYGRAPRSRSRA